jgi:hypothetical protein
MGITKNVRRFRLTNDLQSEKAYERGYNRHLLMRLTLYILLGRPRDPKREKVGKRRVSSYSRRLAA